MPMDMAPIQIRAKTKQMEFRPHWRHHDPSTFNELLTALRCGLMRPFKSTIRRTACENYARAIYHNTNDMGIAQPTAVPVLRANLVRLIETGVHALERDKRVMMRCGARCSVKHAKCM